MMKGTKDILFVVLFVGIVAFAGCATKAQTGAGMGAGLGAAAGSAIGGDTEGTLIGAGVGAIGGYMIGNEMDKQDAARERQHDSEMASTRVVRVHNSNGSVTTVRLRGTGDGRWIGPNGEEYSSFPSEAQLRPVYGF